MSILSQVGGSPVITFSCPGCGKKFHVEDVHAGKKTKCPKCKQAFLVPVTPPSDLVTPTAADITPDVPSGSKTSKRPGIFVGIAIGAAGAFLLVAIAYVARPWAAGLFYRNSGDGSRDARGGSPETEINADTFKPLYRVAKGIEAGQETGLNRDDFGKLLQQYATELGIAKDSLRTSGEKEVFDPYSKALDIWKDSAALWDAKISMPQLRRSAEQYYESVDKASGSIEPITKLFNYKDLIIHDKLPVLDYSSRHDTGVRSLATQYNVPIKSKDGWEYIEADSFKLLWRQAAKKVAEADALRRRESTVDQGGDVESPQPEKPKTGRSGRRSAAKNKQQ
jgi:hypothetical protein